MAKNAIILDGNAIILDGNGIESAFLYMDNLGRLAKMRNCHVCEIFIPVILILWVSLRSLQFTG